MPKVTQSVNGNSPMQPDHRAHLVSIKWEKMEKIQWFSLNYTGLYEMIPLGLRFLTFISLFYYFLLKPWLAVVVSLPRWT